MGLRWGREWNGTPDTRRGGKEGICAQKKISGRCILPNALSIMSMATQGGREAQGINKKDLLKTAFWASTNGNANVIGC